MHIFVTGRLQVGCLERAHPGVNRIFNLLCSSLLGKERFRIKGVMS